MFENRGNAFNNLPEKEISSLRKALSARGLAFGLLFLVSQDGIGAIVTGDVCPKYRIKIFSDCAESLETATIACIKEISEDAKNN